MNILSLIDRVSLCRRSAVAPVSKEFAKLRASSVFQSSCNGGTFRIVLSNCDFARVFGCLVGVSGFLSGFLDFSQRSRILVGVLMFCPEFRVLGGPTKNPK
jgi:hypothetical protein